MLWYKSWRETRGRFLISVVALGWICAVVVLFQGATRHPGAEPMTYVSYVWNAVYKDYVRNLFVVLATIVGAGTLLQEGAHGSVGFTLSLPVSRSQLMAGRMVVGLAQICLLAFIPGGTIAILSSGVGQHYPIEQAMGFGILWVGAGTVIFAVAQLVSAIVANEHVAWIGSFLVIMLYEALVNVTALNRLPALDLFRLMNGTGTSHFDPLTHTLIGPLPWGPFAAMLVVAVPAFIGADRALRRRDF